MRSWRARSTSSSTRNPRGGTGSTAPDPAGGTQSAQTREGAAGQSVRHPRFFRTRHWRDERRHRDPRSATPRAGVRPGLRSDLTYRTLDVTDVFRRGPAAAADEPDAAADEPLRVRGHVFGRTQIDV